jgi:SNF2 family DNA or RNA helicase
VLGDLDAPIGDRSLFAHQKEAIRTMIEWQGGILAHDPGLGKSFSGSMIARAYREAEGCRVIVVGPKTLRANWVREAGWCGVPIEYFTHDSIPTDIPGKFVLIVDEAQAYQSLAAKRSKKFLELAWKAESVICATGTPSKNGRPSNIYPLLLACKHPLVYMEKSDGSPAHDQIKKLRRTFESRYCAAQPTEYSQWDVTGAAYLDELHRKIVDSPHGVLRRRKDQCLDLPAKVRKLVPVELTSAEAETYRNEVAAMWAEYEQRVAKKIEEFKETKLPAKIEENLEWWVGQCLAEKKILAEHGVSSLDVASKEDIALFKAKLRDNLVAAERQRIESGQALVQLGQFRHAGSRAKARATIDIIDQIFEEDAEESLEAERENRSHKPAAVIVFCAYKDTAAQIAEKFGVPVMSGDTPDKQRQPMVDDFQSGENRVFVGIYGAGGVGVTLTAANTVILVDRPWTPGDAEQSEDRAHRIGQDGHVICQWLQIPEGVNPVDAKIDTILQKKQKNIATMLDGAKEGNEVNALEFSREEAMDLFYEATHFKAGKESEVSL